MLFGPGARGMDIQVTLYMPRADWWVHCEVFYEYGIQGQQILSKAFTNFQSFKLNTYQSNRDVKELNNRNIEVNDDGIRVFRFDLFKLIVYTIYYGKKQYEDIKFIS